jgi:SAM-dependent methyltransferase
MLAGGTGRLPVAPIQSRRLKPLDRTLQRWRIAKAGPFIIEGSAALDVGCADGALFRQLRSRIRSGIGIDPDAVAAEGGRFRVIRGSFPADVADLGPFDVITVLAVLEHVPTQAQPAFASACYRLLRPGGRLVVTVPSPMVDRIIDALKALRLIDGMDTEAHFGFEPAQTIPVFHGAGFVTLASTTFQLRLNNLFVFERPMGAADGQAVPDSQELR